MSHFSVLVIGDDIEAQLQPFHEFECTGTNDQYIQDIDETAGMRETYDKDTHIILQAADGSTLDPYDRVQCYREPTEQELANNKPMFGSGCNDGLSWASQDWDDGKGYRPKVHIVPVGYTKVERLTKDHQSFFDYVLDYYGIAAEDVLGPDDQPDKDGKHKYQYMRFLSEPIRQIEGNERPFQVIKRTNPSDKWDWWVIGGRWGGFFWLKEGAVGQLGQPSTMDKIHGDQRNHEKVDVARKGDINFAAMRAEESLWAATHYDKFAALAAQHPSYESWDVIHAKYPAIDEARKVYNDQPLIQAMHADSENFSFFDKPEEFLPDRETYIARRVRRSISTHAVLKDGQWYEKGSMGWWGVVHNEQDEDEWYAQFSKLIDDLPDDTLLSVVDCHI